MFCAPSDARSDTVCAVRQMQTYRAPAPTEEDEGPCPYSVVLGPCPGCDSWQLDYHDEVAQQFVRLLPGEDGSLASIQIDTSPFHEVIEDALREHLTQCPHLRDLVEAYD